MKLSQLQYFQAICKYQNMTHAANALHISQPSLSASVKELEDEFDATLFRRLSKGIELTPAGLFLQKRCNEILRLTDSLAEDMRPFREDKYKLRIGVPPMLCNTVFPKLYQDFQSWYPNVAVSVEEGGTSSLLSLLQEGALDVALISCEPDRERETSDGIRIGSVEIVCYLSVLHPLAGRSRLALEDLRDLPLAVLKRGTYISQFLDRIFKQMQATPNVTMRINHFGMIESLVANNRAVAVLYDNLLPVNFDIVKKSFDPRQYAGVEVVWLKRDRIQPGTKCFLEFVRNYSIV